MAAKTATPAGVANSKPKSTAEIREAVAKWQSQAAAAADAFREIAKAVHEPARDAMLAAGMTANAAQDMAYELTRDLDVFADTLGNVASDAKNVQTTIADMVSMVNKARDAQGQGNSRFRVVPRS